MKILGKYILENPRVQKETVFSWMRQILVQLQAKEQIKELPDKVTPFHIILRENDTVKIGEISRDENLAYSLMGKFVPDKGQNSCIYSFGKTLQFLFAKSELEPKLTWREEAHFQKIISKCLTDKSRKQFQTFSQIELNLPKKKRCFVGIIFIAMITAFSAGIVVKRLDKETRAQAEIFYEQGVIYFLVHRDYDKSEEKFRKIDSREAANYFAEMASYMAGNSEYSALEMELILNEAERLSEFTKGVEEKACLVLVYERVDTPNARKRVCELAKEVLADEPSNIVKEEMRKILGKVYLREGEYEKALREYKILLKENEHAEIGVVIEEIKKRTH